MTITSTRIVLLALAFFTTSFAVAGHHDDADGDQKAVLITGASSGLGRVATERLAAKGYFVYAGARKDKDIAELSAIENVMGVRLDVNVQSDIDAAVKLVRNEGRGLHGLVNNAGVAVLAPLIEMDEDDFHFQMNVNVYGPYRVTRAFAPMIIESKGRITTISSISGVLSGQLFGPYSMTKHAMEAFGDSLAVELAKFDVHVSLIQPGTYQSRIGENLQRRIEDRGQSFEDSLFKEEIAGTIKWATEDLASSGDPQEVAEVIELAMFEENPKHRYLIVPDQRQADVTIRKVIQELTEYNERHKFSFTRDELVQMLDEALAPEDAAAD